MLLLLISLPSSLLLLYTILQQQQHHHIVTGRGCAHGCSCELEEGEESILRGIPAHLVDVYTIEERKARLQLAEMGESDRVAQEVGQCA